jgi:uncharacterized protein (DUF1501 family)
MPQSPLTGNKFLITTYKFGGESNFAKFVPMKNDAFPENSLEKWWTARPGHRYGENGGVFDATVVRNAFTTAGTRLGTTPDYALHPSYAPVMPIWTAGDLAIAPCVGVLAEPLPDFITTIPNYRNIYQYPAGIAAHDRFQVHQTYFTTNMQQFSRGWIGQVMDRIAEDVSLFSGAPKSAVINPRVPGYALHLGNDVVPFTLPANGPSGVAGGSAGLTVLMEHRIGGTFSSNLRSLIAQAVAVERTSVRHQLYQGSFKAAIDGGAFFNPMQTTVVGAGGPLYAVDSFFDPIDSNQRSRWKGMFHRIARIIEATRSANGGAAPIRMALGASAGDWDTHASEKARFESDTANGWTGVIGYAQGLAAFKLAMEHIGAWDECVVTDPTDFGRTLWTNSADGTDHAWAYCMFIAGGLVRGAGKDGSTGLLSPYPAIISTDLSGTRAYNIGGNMAPTHSMEEVYDQILNWFGLTVAERNLVMPNRTRFSNFLDVLDI